MCPLFFARARINPATTHFRTAPFQYSMTGCMGECNCSTHPQEASPPAVFSYPPVSHAYIVHLRRVRAARSRRPLWCSRLFAGSFCIFGFAALLTGSVWLLLSSYSTEIVNMGRNFSRVYTANSLFVKKIIVTNRLQNEGAIIYGLSSTPELDKQVNWTKVYDASVQSGSHQEWGFWLNTGSRVELKYNVSDSNLQLFLVVVQGEENMQKWDGNQSSVDSASTWITVQGVGAFQYEVETDQKYFFAFQNTELEDVEVNVKFNLNSKVHNNENYKTLCHLTSANCAVHLDYLGSNVLLLTTPQIKQGFKQAHGNLIVRSMQEDGDDSWSVNVTFEQQWFTYLVFWGAMAIVMLILLTLCRPSLVETDASQESQDRGLESTVPLMVSQEDNDKVLKADLSKSCSIIFPDDDFKDNEDPENYLCIICFDRQRNCFFDPCGHCATCYACSMKIAKEKKAVCPLCRQPIRLVRKIFVC